MSENLTSEERLLLYKTKPREFVSFRGSYLYKTNTPTDDIQCMSCCLFSYCRDIARSPEPSRRLERPCDYPGPDYIDKYVHFVRVDDQLGE